MVTAFEDTLRELKLANREDPIVLRVANIIIECAEHGMRDAAEMRDCALDDQNGLERHGKPVQEQIAVRPPRGCLSTQGTSRLSKSLCNQSDLRCQHRPPRRI